jgi:putative chitobiose transport system permease protein
MPNYRRSLLSSLRALPGFLLGKGLFATCLLLALLQAVLPFLWLCSSAVKGTGEDLYAFPPQWLPTHWTWKAFETAWTQVPFAQFTGNSLAIATLAIALNLFLSVLAGFAMTWYRFAGRGLAYFLMVLTMAIPTQMILLPLYLLVQQWVPFLLPSTAGIWLLAALPVGISGFGMLYLQQAMSGIPRDLWDAAQLDGASSGQFCWQVVLPLIRPALGTLAFLTFLASWNDFLWPSLLTVIPKQMPLSVGLLQLQGQFNSDWRVVAAASVMALLPSLVLLGLTQSAENTKDWQGGVKG